MTKDILDEILEAHTKNSIILKKLIEQGLNREELLTALFDQFGMTRVKAEAYYSHYEPERKELTKQIGFLSTIINNPAPDWMNDYRNDDYSRTLEKLQTLRKNYIKKRDTLYPKELIPKGLTWEATVNRKVVFLFNIIKPVVDLINKEAGRKRYSDKDIYKLIANFWNITYGVFEGCFTPKQIKKTYDNNFKKYLKK